MNQQVSEQVNQQVSDPSVSPRPADQLPSPPQSRQGHAGSLGGRVRNNCNNCNNGEKLVYGRIARGWTPERVLNLTGEP